jgi:hypothetical protein
MTHGYRRRRKIQTKGIENLFNNIITENFPKLEKGRDIHGTGGFQNIK